MPLTYGIAHPSAAASMLLVLPLVVATPPASFATRAELLAARDAWCTNAASATATYGHISTWDVSRITDFSYVFCANSAAAGCNVACSTFNDEVSGWDTSSATSMQGMFEGASAFDQPLTFDTSKVTNMARMFRLASSFNRQLSSFDTSRVTDMHDMFNGAISFNQPLDSFDTSSVARMDHMLHHARSFNQALSFVVSSVTNMYAMLGHTYALSDCNKALIAAAWSANSAFTANYGSWSTDTSVCLPSPPPTSPPPTSPPPTPPPPPTVFEISGQQAVLQFGRPQDSVTLVRNEGSNTLTCSGTIEAADVRIAGTTTTVADLVKTVKSLKARAGVQPMDPIPLSYTSFAGSDADIHAAFGTKTFQRDGSIFAAIAGQNTNNVVFVNVTDPAAVQVMGVANDGVSGFDRLGTPLGLDVFSSQGRTYVIVAGHYDGVQIIDATNPALPVAASSLHQGMTGLSLLNGAYNIKAFDLGGTDRYALVAAASSNSLLVLNVSNPTQPTLLSTITDGQNGAQELQNVVDVDIFRLADKTYAIACSRADNGIQVIDISDPTSPIVRGHATDGQNGFDTLKVAFSVRAFSIDGGAYAIIAAPDDHGVQMVNLTQPDAPVALTWITVTDASDIEIFPEPHLGRIFAVATSASTLKVIDVTLPRNPTVVAAATAGFGSFLNVPMFRGVNTYIGSNGKVHLLTANGQNRPGGLQVSMFDPLDF